MLAPRRILARASPLLMLMGAISHQTAHGQPTPCNSPYAVYPGSVSLPNNSTCAVAASNRWFVHPLGSGNPDPDGFITGEDFDFFVAAFSLRNTKIADITDGAGRSTRWLCDWHGLGLVQ